MRVRRLAIQDFRNVPLGILELGAGHTFLVGANGQGKTNALEALGLLTALRSFRTQELKALIRWEQKEARLVWHVDGLGRDGDETAMIEAHLGRQQRTLMVDGEKVTYGEFVGRFPTVPLSSEDVQLLRGEPSRRRRFLDLTLAATVPGYLVALRTYDRALRARNQLLKRDRPSAVELRAFERPLANAAATLYAARREGVTRLATVASEVCAKLAAVDEAPGITFAPDVELPNEAAVFALLEEQRDRDERMQTTTRGPHRDDFRFELQGHRARAFASEGQQRGLVVGLRLAQATVFWEALGTRPVLLCDDILTELDPDRKARFWDIVDPETQVVATGTVVPDAVQGQAWDVFDVRDGAFEHRSTK